MAQLVFELLKKNTSQDVSFEEFKSFLKQDTSYENLFNFLSSTASEDRDKIKLKQNLGQLVNAIKMLQSDILHLEKIIDPNLSSSSNSKFFNMWGNKNFSHKF